MSRIGALALLGGVSLAAVTYSTDALAQNRPTQAGGVPNAAQPTSPSQATEAESLTPDIVVTAQKRAENVQDVPVTVAVVTADQLASQNIVTTSDLVQAVPTLSVTNFGVFQIRSLGTQGFGRSAEQSVSVVIDGVAMARPQAYELSNAMFDVDHVEVLSGPQGTLFGRNASAGVINIVTKAPRLREFEVIAHLDVGNHDVVNAQGVLNIPLGSTAALRLVAHHNSTGNIVYNRLFEKWDHNVDDGIRARFRWEPSDNLRINLSGDYQHLHSNGVNGMEGFSGVALYRSVPAGTPLAAVLAGCGIVPGPKNNQSCADTLYAPGVKRGDVYGGRRGGGSLQVDWDFAEGYSLTSITAYRRNDTGDFDVDGDFSGGFGDTLPTNILQRNLFPSSRRMFSQELRVQSPSTDRVNFVAGLYFARIHNIDHVDQAGAFGADLGGLEYRRVSDVDATSYNYGVFGQVNFDVTDKLTVLAGGRVTRDKLSIISANSFPDGPFIYTGNTGFFSLFPISSCTIAGGNPDVPGSCPAGTSLDERARLRETGYSWKLGLQYEFSPRTMAYATVTRGYKGPFINDQAGWPIAASQLVIKSEKPTSYEVGLKTSVFDRMNLAVALFHNKTKNFQTTILVPAIPPSLSPNFIQGNAPNAITKGVDLSLYGNITRNLSLNTSLLYNEAYFSKGFLVSCLAGPCPARRQLPYAPKLKWTVSGEYRRDLGSDLEAFLQADFSYSSKYPFVSMPAPEGLMSEARYLLGSRAGLRIDGDKWGVSVFCRNCLDKRYAISVTEDGFAGSNGGVGADGSRAIVQYFGLSSYRVVGVSLDARF